MIVCCHCQVWCGGHCCLFAGVVAIDCLLLLLHRYCSHLLLGQASYSDLGAAMVYLQVSVYGTPGRLWCTCK